MSDDIVAQYKATIERLVLLCKQLQEENDRLKEKIRTFYGH